MTVLVASRARSSPLPDMMEQIADPDCNLAVWERAVPFALDGLLADWPRGPTRPDNLPKDVRFVARVTHLQSALVSELDAAGFPQTSQRRALIADIADLATRFGAVMNEERLLVRLALVSTNSCHKFHADYVKARLITTYRGTGTQWIEGEDAARLADTCEPAQINTLNEGDVGLFKGKMWTREPVIHRSPPIEGSGEMRLLLVLDPAPEPASQAV